MRDLAVEVMDTNYRLDLGYFYLANAASKLGFADAAKRHARLAADLAKSGDGACAKKLLLNCAGVDVAGHLGQ